MCGKIIYDLARAGGQLAVLVQDFSDVDAFSDTFKKRVHHLVCTIEDLEREAIKQGIYLDSVDGE